MCPRDFGHVLLILCGDRAKGIAEDGWSEDGHSKSAYEQRGDHLRFSEDQSRGPRESDHEEDRISREASNGGLRLMEKGSSYPRQSRMLLLMSLVMFVSGMDAATHSTNRTED